ncbi:hypothetical protein M3B90_09435 [Dermabacter sp. p3-SID358]|uniref:hypothetical protein n=1 Tax=Dermabacter sp. p3-SID358 TaxID=2916114 RepID=UPI0021A68AC7|nr:hypothetical protein [Dermabacter sp. p3-SID358]MCT1867747.1 hypothetical protein [Dermabacter sp. p3-SID358]
MMKGMDPGSVETMAGTLEELATSLRDTGSNAVSTVQSLEWVGEDRENFLAQLGTLANSSDENAARLAFLAENARGQVAEQRAASSAG